MKFEKINGSHLKFSLTYEDITLRGFQKEELWFDREKGEELVWTIIDEVDEIDNFDENEPIFIQVLVGEKGIDMIVTQDTPTNAISHLLKPSADSFLDEISQEHSINHDIKKNRKKTSLFKKNKSLEANLMIKFTSLDDLIDYSSCHTLTEIIMDDQLYDWDNHYYYYVNFDLHHLSPHLLNVFMAQISEFGHIIHLDLSVLQEYGTLVLEDNVVQTFKHNFSKHNE